MIILANTLLPRNPSLSKLPLLVISNVFHASREPKNFDFAYNT